MVEGEQVHLTDKPDMRRLVLDLMHQQTERDKQVKVGASNYANLCSRCLAQDLVATEGSTLMLQNQHWMGAWNGTAIHNRLDHEAQVHRPRWEPEKRLVMGKLEGYGTIKSTSDLYEPDLYTCGDYKTTTKAKLVYIKQALTTPKDDLEVTGVAASRMKTGGYLNQAHSYGRGLTMVGKRVDWVSLIFICRDGTGDSDVWAYTEAYNAQRAEDVWKRLEKMWAWLQNGHAPDELSHHQHCYYNGRS